MSGLFGELNNGIKALTAASRSIETTSRNLANVNNSSYARQRVIYGDRGSVQTDIGVQSMGVEAKQIQQLRDFLLDAQVVRETSLRTSYEAEQAAYQKAQAGLGQSVDRSGSAGSTGSTNGLSQALSEFFNAFQSFAASPTDVAERQSLIQKTGILTDGFKETDQRLSQLQTDLTAQAGSDISDVNSMLQGIADLNSQIGRFEINQPGVAVDLRDQRQALVEQLAGKISIETQPALGFLGQIQVFGRDAGGAQVNLLNPLNPTLVTGPVSLAGSVVSAGTPATALALKGGSINGTITARDGAIATLRTNLNSFARQIVTAVNTVYSPTGNNFFNAAGLTAGTIAIDSTLTAASLKASNGGAVGDNTIAQALANLAGRTFTTPADSIDGTFSQFYSKTVTDLGQKLTTANSHVQSQTAIASLVKSQRDAVSGVSLDEEMADMIKYQRAFQASSRVIQVIDELLDTVVNRLGV